MMRWQMEKNPEVNKVLQRMWMQTKSEPKGTSVVVAVEAGDDDVVVAEKEKTNMRRLTRQV